MIPDPPPPFPDEEFDARVAAVRARMAEHGLDAILVTGPENIYYLSGLNHGGFFAYHMLIVPRAGPLTLIARSMEAATAEAQTPRTRFVGYSDSADPAEVTRETLRKMKLASAQVGVEKSSLCFPPWIYEAVVRGMRRVRWHDVSTLVADLRLVKSERELAYTRRAAEISDAMMATAVGTAAEGVNENEISAEIHREMILRGGHPPGFGPFIRPTPRMRQEHVTWRDRKLVRGEALFLEMAGCVWRYHAPVGRFIFVGEQDKASAEITQVCMDAFDSAVAAMRPGAKAAEVYAAWQDVVDAAGLPHYRRHHCGYVVGLGFPPSWSGGSTVVGLRHDSPMELAPGMVFHVMSWLLGTGRGDYFLSNTVVLTEDGSEVLTHAPAALTIV